MINIFALLLCARFKHVDVIHHALCEKLVELRGLQEVTDELVELLPHVLVRLLMLILFGTVKELQADCLLEIM